jgi:hypothetical protein
LSTLWTRPIWHYFAQGQWRLPCLVLNKTFDNAITDVPYTR